MSEPIQLIYSTGAHISQMAILVEILEGILSRKKLIEVGLYNWPIHDSSIGYPESRS